MASKYVCEECGKEFDEASAYGGHANTPHDSPWRDKETLESLYIDQEMSGGEVADRLDCAESTVREWMKEHGIEPRSHGGKSKNESYKDGNWLREKYQSEKNTLGEIADLANVSQRTIRHYMDKFGIERVPNGPGQKPPKLFTDRRGYECFHTGDNDRFRHHRLLAVAEHGLDAVKDRVVHHKNRITWDNRPENLALMTSSEHNRLHIHEHKPWEDSPR